MDYRHVVAIGFFVVILTAGCAWLAWRAAPARRERTGGGRDTAWTQVDVRYAAAALIFVAFDMEMIFMFPWAVAYRSVGVVAFWDMLAFAIILAAGLMYAAKRGAFRL